MLVTGVARRDCCTISADLAYTRYASVGVAILHDAGAAVRVEFVKLADDGLRDPPDPRVLADWLLRRCRAEGASVLLLDGPQAWKDPDNGLIHQRVCEKQAHTPALTGLPGQVKPATYGPFVAFSIAVFDALRASGASLLAGPEIVLGDDLLVLEAFPLAAWRALHWPVLPAKTKATPRDIQERFQWLCAEYNLQVSEQPRHDELQALVAGLAGVAIGRGATDDYQVLGAPLRLVDDIWREGYIVVPSRSPTAPDLGSRSARPPRRDRPA